MAEKENLRDRIKLVNPYALGVTDLMKQNLREAGYKGPVVEVTEDMSREEKEMALFEGFLKEGCSSDEANRKAKEWLSFSENL